MFYTIFKSYLSILTDCMPHLVISIYGFVGHFISIKREEETWQIPLAMSGNGIVGGRDASEDATTGVLSLQNPSSLLLLTSLSQEQLEGIA